MSRRATLGSSAAEIAHQLGWSTATVHVMHSHWAKEGEAIFDVGSRGGRHHQHLTPEQEKALLAPFVACAEAGGMLTVADIQQAYRERTGQTVARSTVYRLLGTPQLCWAPRGMRRRRWARTASQTMSSPTSMRSSAF